MFGTGCLAFFEFGNLRLVFGDSCFGFAFVCHGDYFFDCACDYNILYYFFGFAAKKTNLNIKLAQYFSTIKLNFAIIRFC